MLRPRVGPLWRSLKPRSARFRCCKARDQRSDVGCRRVRARQLAALYQENAATSRWFDARLRDNLSRLHGGAGCTRTTQQHKVILLRYQPMLRRCKETLRQCQEISRRRKSTTTQNSGSMEQDRETSLHLFLTPTLSTGTLLRFQSAGCRSMAAGNRRSVAKQQDEGEMPQRSVTTQQCKLTLLRFLRAGNGLCDPRLPSTLQRSW